VPRKSETKSAKRPSDAPSADNYGLVDAPRLLEVLFPNEASRPHVKTLLRWAREKEIPFVRLGGAIFFRVEDVRATLDRQPSTKFGRNAA
jgi:hypothetical protein